MQRLYSTFANGLPGKGLLLLRVAIAGYLICDARTAFMAPRGATSILPVLASAVIGVLLCVGLWTPVAGVSVASLELYLLFLRQGTSWASILAVAIASGLALLGPGSWSIDSHVYGRKRISVQNR